MKQILGVARVICFLAASEVAAASLNFLILPDAAGRHPIGATGVSDDGRTVVGFGASQLFRWCADDGLFEWLGYFPGGGHSAALGVSGDGSVIVGHGYPPEPGLGYQPFAWTASTGVTRLFPPGGGALASAYSASFDGSIIVGDYNGGGGGFMFGPDRVARAIPLYNALGISADGRTIFGTSNTGVASVYDVATGNVRRLGVLPTQATSYPRDATPDGSLVVGTAYSSSAPNDDRPFIWTSEAGIQPLTGTTSLILRSADGVSADGSVIVGLHDTGVYVWTAAEGARDLRDFLGDRIPNGLRLWNVRGLSADGHVLVGSATDGLYGQDVAWVATIPSPSALGMLVLAVFMSRPCRSRRP